MENYKTLFDTDLAEHEYIMSQPVKSPEVCARCVYSECSTVECETCRRFDKGKRTCICNTVKDGEKCTEFYPKREDE